LVSPLLEWLIELLVWNISRVRDLVKMKEGNVHCHLLTKSLVEEISTYLADKAPNQYHQTLAFSFRPRNDSC
jgi:hypothetical protein